MSESVTIQVPEEILIKALQQLPPERRRQLFQRINEEPQGSKVELVPFPLESLREIVGIIEVGGDALIESEQIYDE